MAKTKISVYLIREGKSAKDAIDGLGSGDGRRENGRPAPLICPVPGVGDIYYSTSTVRVPLWLDRFFGEHAPRDAFKLASSSAVFLVEVSGRLMAIVFGHGRHLVDMDAIEPRFGLKTVLSSSGDAAFRKVNTTSVAGNAGKSALQLPRLSSLDEFEIDSVIDTLDTVDARIEGDELLGGTVTGGDALSFSTDKGVEEIIPVLGEVLKRYQSDAYKGYYPWIDNISQVKNSAMLSRLKERAIELMVSGDPAIWTAPAEMVPSWDSIAGFRWPGSDGVREDILVEDLVPTFRHGLSEYAQLESKYIEAVDAQDTGHVRFRWSIARCLYGELDLPEGHFCVNAGRWYRIDKDYARDVNSRYKRAMVFNEMILPDCVDMNEGQYNKLLASSGEDCLLMDAKTIHYGEGNSSIELCDVLRGSNTFIHVKHYSGSATLSHLFFQGLNSATMLMSDQGFVDRANEKIKAQDVTTGKHQLSLRGVEQVVYGIICKRYDGQLPNIPFLSRISYTEVERKLRAMRVDCKICAIYEVKTS